MSDTLSLRLTNEHNILARLDAHITQTARVRGFTLSRRAAIVELLHSKLPDLPQADVTLAALAPVEAPAEPAIDVEAAAREARMVEYRKKLPKVPPSALLFKGAKE